MEQPDERKNESAGASWEQLAPWTGPAILLVDLDAFFASVEQLDHPGWRGKPVIVGGSPDARGVVSTASYEARAFGVHSAMPSKTASRLCPDAIWSRGRFARYKEMSDKVMDILRNESPFIQQVSIDEAFLDVTPNRTNTEHPVAVAARIQRRVGELGVTCSIGVGTSKAIAKLASEKDKPRGLTVVYPGSEQSFLDPLPVRALSGIGASSEAKLAHLGIRTLGQLARADEGMIEDALGKNGRTMQQRARGIEAAPVRSDDEVKSVSNEVSFARDISSSADVHAAVFAMAGKVARRLRRKGLAGATVTLKVRYADRSVRTAQTQAHEVLDDEFAMRPYLEKLLDQLWCEGMEVRLVGVAVSGFDASTQGARAVQPTLFDDPAPFAQGEPARGRAADAGARKELESAADRVRDRFGEGALKYGHELRVEKNTTGTGAKNPADYQ